MEDLNDDELCIYSLRFRFILSVFNSMDAVLPMPNLARDEKRYKSNECPCCYKPLDADLGRRKYISSTARTEYGSTKHCVSGLKRCA